MKSIFVVFKGLSLTQIKQLFLEGESPTLNDLQKVTDCHFRHF